MSVVEESNRARKRAEVVQNGFLGVEKRSLVDVLETYWVQGWHPVGLWEHMGGQKVDFGNYLGEERKSEFKENYTKR